MPMRVKVLASMVAPMLPVTSAPMSAMSSKLVLRIAVALLERKSAPTPTRRIARPSTTTLLRPFKSMATGNTVARSSRVRTEASAKFAYSCWVAAS